MLSQEVPYPTLPYPACLLDCRIGLFDGPIALVSSLLAYGRSSDAGEQALQAGLGAAAMAAGACGKEGPLLELSPQVGDWGGCGQDNVSNSSTAPEENSNITVTH